MSFGQRASTALASSLDFQVSCPPENEGNAMSWALIIMLALSSGPGGAVADRAMTTVPGFTSQEACVQAGKEFQLGNGSMGPVAYYCLRVH